MPTKTVDYLDEKERGLLRQSLDMLKKRTTKLAGDLRHVRLDPDEAEQLLTDIHDVREMVPAIALETDFTRAQKGCIAAAFAVYRDELAKTAKSETKIGVPTHATDARKSEVEALETKLRVPPALAPEPANGNGHAKAKRGKKAK